MEELKRVVAINDMSCFGKCSLTVALPVISSFGVEAVPLPTAVLSTHTGGFSGFTCLDMTEEMKKSVSYFEDTPDIIFMIGDISSEMIFKSQFEKNILRNAYILSGGSIPVVYTRGNHETRGEFSSQMLDYFPTNTGEAFNTYSDQLI